LSSPATDPVGVGPGFPLQRSDRSDPALAMSYDAAAKSSKRRNLRKVDLGGEDKVLAKKLRDRVVSSTKDLRRNMAVAAWAMRQHCTHVAQHSFQARTSDPEFNRQLERLVKRQSLPENCDAAKRHSLDRLIWLAEMGRVEDGDSFVILLDDGSLQLIEGNRIGKPDIDAPDDLDEEREATGIRIDAVGRAEAYLIGHRGKSSKLIFDQRWTQTDRVLQHGFFDRPGQVRGISPLASALNAFADINEAAVYALARAKFEQIIGLKIKRAAVDELDAAQAAPGSEGEDAGPKPYKFDLSGGPAVLDLDQGDDAEFLNTGSPHSNFREYLNAMLMAALKALDLDFCFYDSRHTNYSGRMGAWTLYQKTSARFQADVQYLLRRITIFWIERWVAAGELKLPADTEPGDVAFDWIPAGMGFLDLLKETRGHAAAVAAGINSRQRIARAKGEDWFEICDELAAEAKYLAERGLKDDAALIGSTPDTAPSDAEDPPAPTPGSEDA
jgi:capsid protein